MDKPSTATGIFSEESLRQRGHWLIVVLSLLILLPGTFNLPLVDRDEPRFAHATVEMMDRGEWIVPYFNDVYRFDKPPLVYWWMRAHYALFGINDFASRLHSVLGAMASALGLFFMARRWFSATAGFLGGFSFLSCVQLFMHGRLCVADTPVVATVVLSQWALYEMWTQKEHRRWSGWFWLFYLAQAIGILTKGPVTPAFALATAGMYWLAQWKFLGQPLWGSIWPIVKRLQPFTGLPIALGLPLLWFLPVNWATDWAYWQIGVGEHVLDRTANAMNSRTFIPGLYFLTAFLSLMPWMSCASQGWHNLRKHLDAPTLFIASWLVGGYLLFLPVKTQLIHYVLPAMPAFFLLISRAGDFEGGTRQGFGRIWFWLVTAGSLGAVLFFAIMLMASPKQEALSGAILGAGCLLAYMANLNLLPWIIRLRMYKEACLMLLALAMFMVMGSLSLRQDHASILLAPYFEDFPEDTAVMGWEYGEPSLVWYTGFFRDLGGNQKQLAEHLSGPGPRAAVVLQREWDLGSWLEGVFKRKYEPNRDMIADGRLEGIDYSEHTVTTLQGINLARFSWMELDLVYVENAAAE